MSLILLRIAQSSLAVAALGAFAPAAFAQHDAHAAATQAPPRAVVVSAHVLPLFTRATPTAGRASLSEAYLSQLAAMAMGNALGGRLEGTVMVNLEGLTLERGELTTGAYGEGYVDRRHPHAYLHEVIATARTPAGSRRQLSLSAGRGFATFGSDDPMIRPFAKYPVNHHLAQILERGMVAGAVRLGLIGLEASVFNGDEPRHASDLPTFRRIGDSWAARLTAYPRDGIEVALSHASVESPEVQAGFGADARKWHAGLRFERGPLYALAEWARSTDEDDGRAGQAYVSLLSEIAYDGVPTRVAVRLERTDRHEEERLENPFRTGPGTGGAHVLAVTRWVTVTVAGSRRLQEWRGMALTPFVEAAVAVPSLRSGIAFDPAVFYGARRLAMLSAGARLTAGGWHRRMGRYGVAESTTHLPHR